MKPRRFCYPLALGVVVAAWWLCTTGLTTAQTVNWGPFRLNLGATAGFTYTDNDNNSEDDPQSDLEFNLGPTVSGGITIAPTLPGGEQLVLNLAAAYTLRYSLEEGMEETFSAPIAVNLSLPFRLGGWDIILSDVFTFSNEPLEATFAFNRDDVPQYSNSAGLSVGRNFGRVGLTFAASRQDKIFPDDPEMEEVAYSFSVTPAYFFRDNYSVFLRNTYGITDRTDPDERDSIGYSSELGLSGQITPSLSGSISMGYSHTELTGGAIIDENPGGPFGGVFDRHFLPKDNVDGISSTISMNYVHPLRPNTSYGVSFSRSPGITAALEDSDITEVTSATLSIAHRLSRKVTLTPVIGWSYLVDKGNPETSAGEEVQIISIGLGTSRQFTRKLSGSINYRFQSRMSNLDGQSYDVNTVTGALNYTF